MKKYLFVSVIILLIIALFLTWLFSRRHSEEVRVKKSALADEQADLLRLLGNGKIEINDPHYRRSVDIDFKDSQAEMNVSGDNVKYEIKDALEPYNLDNDIEKEYPFLISAYYPNKSTSYLIISHSDNQKFITEDLVEVGDPSKIEDLHREGNEVLIDANVADNQGGSEQVILSYKFENNKIVPSPNNPDINKVVSVSKAPAKSTTASKANGSGASGKVALTFDDGPGTYTPQILSVLSDYGVTATFFEIGENAAAHPDYVKQIAAAGHEFGDHTYTHPDLTKLSYDGQYDEISKAKQTIESISGASVRYFRPPYGSYNADTDKVVAALNLDRILWNVDPRDWSGVPADSIVQNVLANSKSGSIVLMHDGVVNSKETAKALPQIIEGLRNKGFKLVPMSQM